MTSSAWAVAHRHGPAGELHALELADPVGREVWVLTPDRPALVLGSTQNDDLADPVALAALGVDLVRRRSGGGAVLLDPTGALGDVTTCWVDVIVPRDDPLWTNDIGRSTDWLGSAWVRALADLGVSATVHHGALARSADSSLVCFAGVGPGEVLVGGRKVVGISQRRSRAGARFQCVANVVPADCEPERATNGEAGGSAVARITDLLREPVTGPDRDRLVARLRVGTTTVAVPVDALVDALVRALPDTPDLTTG